MQRVARLMLVLGFGLALPGCDFIEDLIAGKVKDQINGQEVRQSIGVAGGSVEHPNGAALHVPPGALAADVELTLKPVAAPDAQTLGAQPLGNALDLGPDGTQFLVPVDVVVPFDRSKLPEGTEPNQLRVMIAPGGSTEFAQLDTVVDLDRGVLIAKTMHFSTVVPALPPKAVFITGPATLPEVARDEAFLQSFSASGGTAPYTWSIASGALPQGLLLQTGGVLQGIPTQAGTFAFSVRVADSSAPSLRTEKGYSLTVTAPLNPHPTVTAMSPSQLTQGTGEETIVVSGQNFIQQSRVVITGQQQRFEPTTTFNSPVALSALVPASVLSVPGTYRLWVETPAPGGGTSNVVTFEVLSDGPRLDSIEPSILSLGESTTLYAYGSAFENGAQILVDGTALSTGFVNATTLRAGLNGSLLGLGPHDVVVKNPDGKTSGAMTLTVVNPRPIVSNVSPTSLASGAGDTQVEVTGSNFVSSTFAVVGAQGLATDVLSATQMRVVVPASMLQSAGTLELQAYTPEPGGGYSTGSVSITVTGAAVTPVLTSLTPATVEAGSDPSQHHIDGTGFSAVSQVLVNGTPVSLGGPVYPTVLEFILPAELKQNPGALSVTVRNGHVVSNALTLTVTGDGPQPSAGAPLLTSISPASVQQYSADTVVTLTGENFSASSLVFVQVFGGQRLLKTTYVSPTQLTTVMPASYLASPNQGLPLTVIDRMSGAASDSKALAVLIGTASLRLDRVLPPSIPADADWTTITIEGVGFTAGATVLLGGEELPTYMSNNQRLLAAVPPDASRLPGSHALTVRLSGGATTGAKTFEFTEPGVWVPYISGLQSWVHDRHFVGAITATLQVQGANFDRRAIAKLDDVVVFGSGSATGFYAEPQKRDLLTPGIRKLRISNPHPDGGWVDSNAYDIFVSPVSAPKLASVSPATVAIGSSDLPVFAHFETGTRPTASTTYWFAGEQLTPASDNGSNVSLWLPQHLLANAGTKTLEVRDPALNGGKSSVQISVSSQVALPVITSITPNVIAASTTPITVGIRGTNIPSFPTVYVGNATSGSKLQNGAYEFTRAFTEPGTFEVRVVSNGVASAPMTITVTGTVPPPTITGITPSSMGTGSADTKFRISTQGVVAQTTRASVSDGTTTVNLGVCPALWENGSTLDLCDVTVPEALFAGAGTLTFTLTHSGGHSNIDVPVEQGHPTPRLYTGSGTLIAGQDGTLRVFGEGLFDGTVVEEFATGTPLTTLLVAPRLLEVTVPASMADPGAGVPLRLRVRNPAPGGGEAASLITLQVQTLPKILSMTPTTVTAGQAATLTLETEGLPATGYLVSSIGRASMSGSTVTIDLQPGDVPLPAKVPVTLRMEGQGESNAVSLTVTAP